MCRGVLKYSFLAFLGLALLLPLAAIAEETAGNSQVVTPDDVGLQEGDLISASDSDDPDVYIISKDGYKRLFLNPEIFKFYGHLGGFHKVKKVSPEVRDAFRTSTLFRNCETDDQKVYNIEVTEEDAAELQAVDVSGETAVREDAAFFRKVFCINSREFNWYRKAVKRFTSVREIPEYYRHKLDRCRFRPPCLDSEPRCLLPEPADGWCPKPPERPGCYYKPMHCIKAPCEPQMICPIPSPRVALRVEVKEMTAHFVAKALGLPDCVGYKWTFGDGTVEEIARRCAMTNAITPVHLFEARHAYEKPGTYVAYLEVGDTASNKVEVTVPRPVICPAVLCAAPPEHCKYVHDERDMCSCGKLLCASVETQ